MLSSSNADGTCCSVEPVKVVYEDGHPHGPRELVAPAIAPRSFIARKSYINSCTGLQLSRDELVKVLNKMGHEARPASTPFEAVNYDALYGESKPFDKEDAIQVLVPATRPDIMHECDIMEDAAVGYGFDNLKKTFPSTSTVAVPFAPNKLSDIMRRLCAEAGWLEVLPLILCSHEENFEYLNRKDDGSTAVLLANPKTIEYQMVRTSLLPGLLKSIRENRKHSLPLRIFEVSDVMFKDPSVERQARNERHVAAMYCARKAEFEVVHGLLDRLMLGLGIPNLVSASSDKDTGYYIAKHDHDTFFPGRSAKVMYRMPSQPDAHVELTPAPSADPQAASAARSSDAPPAPEAPKEGPLDTLKEKLAPALPTKSRDVEIGYVGILHPSVLKAYELDFPCSTFEFNLEPFL